MHFSCIPSLYIITRLDNVMNINKQYMRMMFIRRTDGNGLLCRSFRKKKKNPQLLVETLHKVSLPVK